MAPKSLGNQSQFSSKKYTAKYKIIRSVNIQYNKKFAMFIVNSRALTWAALFLRKLHVLKMNTGEGKLIKNSPKEIKHKTMS